MFTEETIKDFEAFAKANNISIDSHRIFKSKDRYSQPTQKLLEVWAASREFYATRKHLVLVEEPKNPIHERTKHLTEPLLLTDIIED
jgi:hypothetical protein